MRSPVSCKFHGNWASSFPRINLEIQAKKVKTHLFLRRYNVYHAMWLCLDTRTLEHVE